MSEATERVASAVAEAAASAGQKTAYAGSAMSVVGGWLLSSEGIAIVGLCIALAGWLTQLFFALRRDWREQREHQARMAMHEQSAAPIGGEDIQ